VAVSPLPGPSGNVEFFLWLRRGPAALDADAIGAAVRTPDPASAPGERVEP
jgi:23S rRNA (cytidine1920-2'-O)/16S rRNA (cytidine1409-2'-O)-methyltransferase